VNPKFGFVLPSYIASPEREAIAVRSYSSLAQSIIPDEDQALPVFVVVVGMNSMNLAIEYLMADNRFRAHIKAQPVEVSGLDPSLAWIVEKLFAETECSHIVELADDMIYHPQWFIKLKALVERHPDARAWNVYRSAHTRHHRTIRQSDDEYQDHLVTSMAGNGTCWTREEWNVWGVNWKQGPTWPVPTGGDTLDLHHAYFRPGDRWATDKSYMQHIGIIGVHCHPGTPEHALNFVEGV